MANARSLADWNRRSGFFSRQRRMMRSSPGDTCPPEADNSDTSSFRMAFMVSTEDSPLNARLPETIS